MDVIKAISSLRQWRNSKYRFRSSFRIASLKQMNRLHTPKCILTRTPSRLPSLLPSLSLLERNLTLTSCQCAVTTLFESGAKLLDLATSGSRGLLLTLLQG